MRRPWHVFAVFSFSLGCAEQPGVSPAASAQPPGTRSAVRATSNVCTAVPGLAANTPYRISLTVNAGANRQRCLDVDNNSIHDTFPTLQQKECNAANNQEWLLFPAPQNCWYLVNKAVADQIGTGYMMAGPQLGNPPYEHILYGDQAAAASHLEYWDVGSGNVRSTYMDMCLDWENEHPDPGGHIQLKACSGVGNQGMSFQPF